MHQQKSWDGQLIPFPPSHLFQHRTLKVPIAKPLKLIYLMMSPQTMLLKNLKNLSPQEPPYCSHDDQLRMKMDA